MKIFFYSCELMSFNLSMLCFCYRLPETLERLAAKLELVYNASGGKKINIISHSMGGLLVKCFMSLHSDVRIYIPFLELFLFSLLPFHPISFSFKFGYFFLSWLLQFCFKVNSPILMHFVLQIFEKYVKNWIAIAAPFQGKWSYTTWTHWSFGAYL